MGLIIKFPTDPLKNLRDFFRQADKTLTDSRKSSSRIVNSFGIGNIVMGVGFLAALPFITHGPQSPDSYINACFKEAAANAVTDITECQTKKAFEDGKANGVIYQLYGMAGIMMAGSGAYLLSASRRRQQASRNRPDVA